MRRLDAAAPSLAPLFALLVASACGVGCSDVSIAGSARCDGELQSTEETLDAPFDRDGDGYFDGANEDCVETYGATVLDCDDADPDAHPGGTEAECNGVDDDCDAATPDVEDLDGDLVASCDDCNDTDPAVSPNAIEVACNGKDDDCREDTPDAVDADADGTDSCGDCDDAQSLAAPGLDETCDDAIDNDCDGAVDEGCFAGYSDVWTLDQTVSYSCAWGNVNISFASLLIEEAAPTISFTSIGGGSQPGTMTGTLTGTDFATSRFLPGTCNETYTFEGWFDGENSFGATFEAEFTGSLCLDCTSRSWTVVGTRS